MNMIKHKELVDKVPIELIEIMLKCMIKQN